MDLSKWILFESLQKLSRFLEGTEAAAHIDMASEKTAGSVRSVASSFLRCLKYIEDTDTPFSIRKWVQNDNKDDSWLFLSCDPGERAAFVSLISCWFSVAARSLLRTKPDFNRRLWFVIDELSTLHKLKELEPLLAESRKYGGCALLALQSPAQIEDIYGRAICRTILGLCATKIIFSEMDAETAERISKSFGNHEFKEIQESVSYGAHEMRDGVSLSSQVKQQPLVSASQIHALEANQCFIKLFGNIPIAKLKLKIST
ncbi:MAG TPA: type IV secretion system DNA-binding domain-containing protein [Parachlamydiaceae bacterium]|nr:type IV secretion system DNA-binding domain-containing protein [Parachlamydiaceae bacterium]